MTANGIAINRKTKSLNRKTECLLVSDNFPSGRRGEMRSQHEHGPVGVALEEGAARGARGIGIRIEDDVLITADGCEVLTAGTPKTIDEVERVCAETSRLPRP